MPVQRVRLRPVRKADLPHYVRWFNDPEVTRWLMRDAGITMEQEREWFRHLSENPHEVVLAIEAEGRHIGGCGLTLRKDSPVAYFGISIGDTSAWGKGYGTAATREMLRIGFEERGLERIQLETWAQNVGAQRCYEKCGFRYEGVRRRAVLKQGEWLDVVMMAILREEWQAMVSPPQEGLCPLGPEHAAEALRLWKAADLWLPPGDNRPRVRNSLAHTARFSAGWRASGRLVGTAIGAFDGLRGWIYHVAVHPKHQRRGIATALMEEVESRLRAAGVARAALIVWTGNEGARALYEKIGYEAGEEVTVMFKGL